MSVLISLIVTQRMLRGWCSKRQTKLKLTFLPVNVLDLLMLNSNSDLKCVKLDLARISK